MARLEKYLNDPRTKDRDDCDENGINGKWFEINFVIKRFVWLEPEPSREHVVTPE